MRTYIVNEYDQEDYSRVKEEMTDHEAVRILEKIERGFLPGYDFTGEPGISRIIDCTSQFARRSRR